MSDNLAEVIKKNWYLAIICVGLMATGAVMGLRGSDDAEGATVTGTRLIPAGRTAGASSGASNPWAKLQRGDQQVMTSIKEYEHRIHDEDPTEDTDMDMMRAANLYYSKLRNYDEAAKYYEMLMDDYPDFEMASIVYQNLGECYHRMGENTLERGVYRRMMKHFPRGTNEHDFAVDKLGIMASQ